MGTASGDAAAAAGRGGRHYNEVLEATRRDAAEQYLAGRVLSIGEIGYLLGYSEPAAFHRAFKRWHGHAGGTGPSNEE
jgi:AraC-like DNA-binding protein